MVQDDNVTQIGQAYHAIYHNIDVWRDYGYHVKTGGEVTPGSDGGLSVDVSSGTCLHNGNKEDIPEQTSLSLAAADPNDPRKDLIVYTGSGNVTDVTGTPNPIPDIQDTATRFDTFQPSPPDGTGLANTPVVLAEVWVAAGAATIQAEDINDLRTGWAQALMNLRVVEYVQNESGAPLLDPPNARVADTTVDTAAIQADAVSSTEIATGAVTSPKINSDAVTETEIDQSISPTWTGQHGFEDQVLITDDGGTLPDRIRSSPVILRGSDSGQGIVLQNQDDGQSTGEGRANITWYSDSEEYITAITAHPAHNHFSVYTRNAPLGTNANLEKRMNINAGSNIVDVEWKNIDEWILFGGRLDTRDRMNPPSYATAGNLPIDADSREPDVAWVEDEGRWYTYVA